MDDRFGLYEERGPRVGEGDTTPNGTLLSAYEENKRTGWRWVILALTCFGMTGQYFAFDVPAQVNHKLKHHMHPGSTGR